VTFEAHKRIFPRRNLMVHQINCVKLRGLKVAVACATLPTYIVCNTFPAQFACAKELLRK
jgi:hypothetical protein